MKRSKFLQVVTKNPVLLSNLLLRMALLAYVLFTQHWVGGDTPHYLGFADQVCDGQWGGEANRGPFYLWYLCLLSPNVSQQASSLELILPLFFQTLLIWLGGVWIFFQFRKEPRFANLLSAIWLFDPVFLVYSNLVMSDALFGLSLLAITFWMKKITQSKQRYSDFIMLGLCLSVSALIRAVALPLLGLTLLLMLFQKAKMSHWVVLVAVVCACLAPRVYWNKTRFNVTNIANQGESWMMSVAGIVENHGKGLDFFQSEAKWFKDHQHKDKWEAYRTIYQNFGTWAYLSLKGMARVLFGHVNIEWAVFATGEAPLGPAWFKVQEHRPGDPIEGGELIVWVIGLFGTAIFCLAVYFYTLRQLVWWLKLKWIKRRSALAEFLFVLWCFLAILGMAFTPQVFGDARFRTGVWPILIVLLGFLYMENKKAKT